MLTPLSDDDIGGLISERKPLPQGYDARLRLKAKRGHKEAELDFEGAEASPFRLIVRQSIANPLDFSLILAYRVPGTNIVFRLRRYNGKSHEHTNKLEMQTFYGFHIHLATFRYQEAGFSEDAYAEPTDRYASLNGALECMLANCAFDVPPRLQPRLAGLQ